MVPYYLSITLGIVASVIQVAGYWLYAARVAKPSTGSWAMWTVSGFSDLASYAAMTEDWVKNILPASCAIACIATFAWCLYKRRLSWPTRSDWWIFALDCMIAILWCFTSALVANLLFQVRAILSYVPTIRDLKTGRSTENIWPWTAWVIAYLLFLVSVVLRLERFEELVYPVNFLILSSIVTIFIVMRDIRSSRV